MHLFTADDTLQKFDNVTDIIDAYYEVRLKLYQTRKDYIIESLKKELILLTNKAKYIKENIDGTIDLRKKKKDQVIELLKSKEYDIIGDDIQYQYLTKMAMDSVTEENVERLYNECGNKESELQKVQATTISKMWCNELDLLKNQYMEYKEERTRLMNGEDIDKDTKKKAGAVKKLVKNK
jgi:DNA topoisomerase-2